MKSTTSKIAQYLPRTQTRQLSDSSSKKPRNISVTFILPNGDEITGKAKDGDTFLDVVVDNDLDIDGFGACEGTCACSSCHVIFKDEDYKKLKYPATDEEMDMLDLAFDLTDTSRLGCQIQIFNTMDGIVVRVPASINDARVG